MPVIWFISVPHFSRVPFSFYECIFRFFSRAGFFSFHGCDCVIIFTGKKWFSRPHFLRFSEFFTGHVFVYTGKIGKYCIFFTGACSFFTHKKKHCSNSMGTKYIILVLERISSKVSKMYCFRSVRKICLKKIYKRPIARRELFLLFYCLAVIPLIRLN